MQYQKLGDVSNHGGITRQLGEIDASSDSIADPKQQTLNSKKSLFSIETGGEDAFFDNIRRDNRNRGSLNDVSSSYSCLPGYMSLWSSLTFSWMKPLLILGKSRPLEASDLGNLDVDDQSEEIFDKFQTAWNSQSSKKSFPKALSDAFGYPFYMAGLLKLVHDSCLFLGPVLLNRIIVFLKDPSQPLSRGLFFVFLLFITQSMMAICIRQYFWWCYRVGMRLRSAIVTSVFNKSLVLATSAFARRSTGEITNLMSVDSTRLQDLTPYLHAIWYSFYQIAIALYLLWRQVSYASLAGICVIIISIPATRAVSRYLQTIQKKLSKIRDERVKLCNEVFIGIKVIKLQAWEKQFQTRILDSREQELQLLRHYMIVQALSSIMYNSIPLLVSIATFTAYILIGNNTLDVATVLTSLALFDLLRFPLFMLPNVINNLIEARVSVDRVQSYLLEPDCSVIPTRLSVPQSTNNIDEDSVYISPKNNKLPRAAMRKATLVWESAASRKISRPTMVGNSSNSSIITNIYSRFNNFKQYLYSKIYKQTTSTNLLSTASNPLHGNNQTNNQTSYQSDSEFFVEVVNAQQNETEALIDHLTDKLSISQLKGSEFFSKILNDTTRNVSNKSQSVDPRILTLFRVSLSAYPNQIVSIVGKVGSGKSSLLSGFLGEIKCFFGEVAITGKVAYVGQRPFIQNASIRDNITFGLPYNEFRYKKVIEDCCLIPDLEILPGGDLTEIGERGINISGGQKARVALARAVYSNADVYLLDDPLSAVDAEVGQKLFEGCILPLRESGATVLLVTNALQFLRMTDYVVVLDGGKVVDSGTYQQLLANANISTSPRGLDVEALRHIADEGGPLTPFASLMSAFIDTMSDNSSLREGMTPVDSVNPKKAKTISKSDEGCASNMSVSNTANSAKGKLTSIEDREVGDVGSQIYLIWLRAAGGVWVAGALAILNSSGEAVLVINNWWLSQFSSDYGSKWFHLGVYMAISASVILIYLACDLFLRLRSIRASKVLFKNMLSSVLYSPMSFFDQTPNGRISNRFVKDIYQVDEKLPVTIRQYVGSMCRVASALIYICIVLPIFSVVLFIVGSMYYLAQRFYIKTSRELSRLDSISRSPIYALFSEALDGLSTIRAFNKEDMYRNKTYRSLDSNQRAYFLNFSANCWLGVRLDLLGSVIIFFAALLGVLGRQAILSSETRNSNNGDTITPEYVSRLQVLSSLAGLAISLALSCTQSLNWSVRMASDLESQMVSVERIHSYSSLPQEAAHYDDYDDEGLTSALSMWPVRGSVEFQNVGLRYREGLPLVLKGLNLIIKGGEKIGIVGRTGAGKSTLLCCLMRLVEISEGRVLIDGTDISILPLHTLRSKIAVIPQDPVLFSGTLRSNLDPFSLYTDMQIRDGLRRCHLEDMIGSGSASNLDLKIEENGSNLSVGQRQLLCIARALLSSAKIIIMDEATAAVDVNTDASIQRTLRQEFAHCTCLTIAHRLNTIMDSDRVLVMSEGEAAEFDTPTALLGNPNSMFSNLVANWETSNQ